MENLSISIEGSELTPVSPFAPIYNSNSEKNEFFLDDNIYQGFYKIDNEEYFCFFKKIDNQFVDIISKDICEIEKFNEIILNNNIPFVKYIQLRYKTDKSLNLFKRSNNDSDITMHYIDLLRFFNLSTPYIINSPIVERSTLDAVIEKIQKYFKNYVSSSEIAIYVTQLKKFNNLKEILNFCPKEFVEKKNPFWFSILKEHGFFVHSLSSISIKIIKTLNELNLNVIDLQKNKKLIEDKIAELKEVDILNYRQKCFDEINRRLNDGKKTITKEEKEAKESEDVELIFEINVIKEEIAAIEKDIENILSKIDMNDHITSWWPQILYPIPSIRKRYNIEQKKMDDLTNLYYIL